MLDILPMAETPPEAFTGPVISVRELFVQHWPRAHAALTTNKDDNVFNYMLSFVPESHTLKRFKQLVLRESHLWVSHFWHGVNFGRKTDKKPISVQYRNVYPYITSTDIDVRVLCDSDMSLYLQLRKGAPRKSPCHIDGFWGGGYMGSIVNEHWQ
eukprot:42406-Eustigmatos_ZCMA.PRE.1